jgi:hypothetical protein
MADVVYLRQPEPELETLRAYRGVYVLCTVERGKPRKLRATHYAMCLISGAKPVWGVWKITGAFLRFHGGKTEVERAYPRLIWKRHMASWQCVDMTDKSLAARRLELETTFGKQIK